MKRFAVAVAVFILAGLGPNKAQREVWSQASAASESEPAIGTIAHAQELVPAIPTRISIPSIKLNSPIQQVGVDEYGRMDVPSGLTNKVGWYKKGPLPGEKGSAVLDAHVFAAFKNLNKINIGDPIFVTDREGTERRFVVQKIKYFELAKLSPNELFNKKDAKRLTLITCAGKKIGGKDGYDQRLVVYATLAEDSE